MGSPFSSYIQTLFPQSDSNLINDRKKRKIALNFCGLLRIYELYRRSTKKNLTKMYSLIMYIC